MNIKRKSLIAALLMFAASFLVGCPKAPLSYKLQRSGTTAVMIPPNLPSIADEKSPRLVSILKNARRKSVVGTNCDIEGPVVSLYWHDKAAEIRLSSESYIAERGMYLDPLRGIKKFHAELLERESRGCFSSTDARRIRRAVAERFPLPPSNAYRYELGSYDTTGYPQSCSVLQGIGPQGRTLRGLASPRICHFKHSPKRRAPEPSPPDAWPRR
jgi:hypothetical protein